MGSIYSCHFDRTTSTSVQLCRGFSSLCRSIRAPRPPRGLSMGGAAKSPQYARGQCSAPCNAQEGSKPPHQALLCMFQPQTIFMDFTLLLTTAIDVLQRQADAKWVLLVQVDSSVTCFLCIWMISLKHYDCLLGCYAPQRDQRELSQTRWSEAPESPGGISMCGRRR